MLKSSLLLFTTLVLTFACTSNKKRGYLLPNEISIEELEIIAPKLLNKTVAELGLKSALDSGKIFFSEEPPGIIRGFFYRWTEELTVEFMTGRSSSIILRKDLSKYERQNFTKIDFQNLQNKPIIGINWGTADAEFYLGTGFVWPLSGYIDSTHYHHTIQEVARSY